jgi:succinyl-CoA synthetase alpha subunit
MPGKIHKRGSIGVVSRSGTLTYEVVDQLTKLDMGQSTCIGIGGDPVNGTNFIDVLSAFQADDETSAIVMVGEIGGSAEEEAAAYINEKVTKPVVGFIAGLTAPPGRRMGHAGAIISGSSGTGEAKIAAFKANGIHVCENLGQIGRICKDVF